MEIPEIGRTVEAVVLDWDGTAVANRRVSARPIRRRVLALTAAGVDVAIVSGTHVENIDRQLWARPAGPGRLWLGVNRGSELFEVTATGPELVDRRQASADEDRALDASAEQVVASLRQMGLETQLVGARLNRRKIDLIPLPEWADPPKSRIAELVDATTQRLRRCGISGLPEVVGIAVQAAEQAGLERPRITSDAKHVEIGLTDKSDSMLAILALLAARGIGAGLVLVVGDEFAPIGGVAGSDSLLLVPEADRATVVSVGVEPGGLPPGIRHEPDGPRALFELLDEQLRRRRRHRVPSVDEDPAWIVRQDSGDPLRRRVAETIFTLGASGLATRGSVEEAGSGSTPLVAADGVYRGPHEDNLLPGPLWTGLTVDPRSERDERVLDLRTGVLTRQGDGVQAALRTLRFVSAARGGVVALRAEAAAGRLQAGPPLQAPAATAMSRGRLGTRHWARTGASDGPGIGAIAQQHAEHHEDMRIVERIGAYLAGEWNHLWLGRAAHLLETATATGFDRLLAEHRHAWADRWEAVNVSIPDDPDTQLAVRFALFQLWCNVNRHDESAVGARGLSGSGYAGHVFWDADVFVLPAMVSIDPAAAQAMVAYRLRRLDAARAYAAANGHDGARFPWESAASGDDVTPSSGQLGGTIVPILTGPQEEHITADVAWAAAHRAAWTSPTSADHRSNDQLLIETARYWASRCRRGTDGSAHIDTVIGPDEYHETVDDNAFTNVMARWNLRAGADAAERAGAADAARQWRELAEHIVDGYDPSTGRYEQFAGYFDLEPLLIADVATPPVAVDLLLGRERVAASQLIKQPDVLMLHHLLPDDVAPGSLLPNLDFYLPRTAHGSSLSVAVSATLLARAGRADEALEVLRLALTLDLDDQTGMTAAGLHLANLAGVWQAILAGFAGVKVRDGTLIVDPRLPTAWGSLEVRFRCLGRQVQLRIGRDTVSVQTDGPLSIRTSGGAVRLVSTTAELAYTPAEPTTEQAGSRP